MDMDTTSHLKYIGLSAAITRGDGTTEDLGTLCETLDADQLGRVEAGELVTINGPAGD